MGTFAAILADKSVVTWGPSGSPHDGRDSSGFQHQLKDVRQVQFSQRAFATILADESVVTWGNPDYGGNLSEVQDQFKSVKELRNRPKGEGFAAIRVDRSVLIRGIHVESKIS